MQVKKFEAPTIQEALDTIKRELGPEAIILQTKQNKRGFGLMSKGSVEVTAAVSERSLHKKVFAEKRLPSQVRDAVAKTPATRQADIYDQTLDKHLEKTAQGKARDEAGKKITATRYIDIDTPPVAVAMAAAVAAAAPAPDMARASARIAYGNSMATDAANAAGIGSPVPRGDSAGSPIGVRTGPQGQGMTVEEEVRQLKRMIQELKVAQEEAPAASGARAASQPNALATQALQDAFEQLVVNGVDRRYALALIKKASFELHPSRQTSTEHVLDQLAVEIMETTETTQLLPEKVPANTGGGPMVLAFVGPTGVGKTTTAAKIASDCALRRKLKVGLINLDSHKAGAFDQLAIYAKILNLPFRSAATMEDFHSAIRDFQSLDVVLVDTTGRSQRDPAAIHGMKQILDSITGVRTQLVLSVTTRDTEMFDMASRFSVFRPSGLILSKLDESTVFGSIYNVTQRARLPLIYFTTGQKVPEDLEEATRERVASLILEI
ncbi:MAG TPA: flagellar biosynthesis protein FlhF [Bdellovibrionota bacterium]|nr:flagellar biosynthesis protein FlhF [Bdellovibrionota bacterium]